MTTDQTTCTERPLHPAASVDAHLSVSPKCKSPDPVHPTGRVIVTNNDVSKPNRKDIFMFKPLLTVSLIALGGAAFAAAHAPAAMVEAADQDVTNGIVSAAKVVAPANGWLVVHRTDAEMKPGPVVGYAPLRMGDNMDVAAILTESVASGEMLMLMVHAEDGGMMTGGFEYTLGAKEDGPIRVDDKLVMQVVTAK